MKKIILKIVNFLHNYLGVYTEIITVGLIFGLATLFYNIGENTYENTFGETTGFFGITARIIFLLITIYTFVKLFFACKNQYNDYKETQKNEKNSNK